MEYAHERGERRQGRTKPSKPVVLPPLSTAHWPYMSDYLKRRGLSHELAVINGWYPTVDHTTPRIVIPAQSLVNTWPYYQARAMSDNPKRYASPSAPRGDALVVCYPRHDADHVVIVEGPMDALAAAEVDCVGIALMGNTPSDDVLRHLRELASQYSYITVLSDVDAHSEAVEITHRLWTAGCMATFRTIKGYKDLAEVPYAKRQQVIED